MPCLSSKAASDLNDSISVSNAESQLAVPLMITTGFGVNVISSPNGSAIWTGAGDDGVACVAAAGGGAGGGLADGAGAGAAGVAGVAAAGGAGVGAGCANAAARWNEIAATGTNAAMARRNGRGQLIRYLHGLFGAARLAVSVPATSAGCKPPAC